MLSGTYPIGGMEYETVCRICVDVQKMEVGKSYPIHSTILMPEISFGKPESKLHKLKKSVFMNAKKCKLTLPKKIAMQNFATIKYIGRIPNEDVKMGAIFTLISRDRDATNEDYIMFGTTDFIHGYDTTYEQVGTYSKSLIDKKIQEATGKDVSGIKNETSPKYD